MSTRRKDNNNNNNATATRVCLVKTAVLQNSKRIFLFIIILFNWKIKNQVYTIECARNIGYGHKLAKNPPFRNSVQSSGVYAEI